MAKRGSNIYKRKDGRFEGRVPIGYQDNGKIKYKSVYARTLSEVKEKMSEMYSVRQNRAASPVKLYGCRCSRAMAFFSKIEGKGIQLRKL